jgi:hypothetical protein
MDPNQQPQQSIQVETSIPQKQAIKSSSRNKFKCILAIIICLVLISLGVSFGLQNLVSNKEKNNLQKLDEVSVGSYLMGAFFDERLYSDGSFFKIDMFSTNSACLNGKISIDQYQGFAKYIKTTGITKLKKTYSFEPGLMCDGGGDFFIRAEGKEYYFGSGCSTKETSENNQKIEKIEAEITSKLDQLLKISEKSCVEGGYMEIIEVNDCLFNKTHDNILDLPSFIIDGISSGKKYVYVGQIDDEIRSWKNQYIKLKNVCYYTDLYQFSGGKFDTYYR